ncbi:unnamed protein product [Closterium sp. NIES-53]
MESFLLLPALFGVLQCHRDGITLPAISPRRQRFSGGVCRCWGQQALGEKAAGLRVEATSHQDKWKSGW